MPVCLCGGSAATIPAAEQHLPANLCPLIKSTFGYHVTGKNPFLNWADLVVAETTCDGKKKMFELLGASKPMYVLELPQKAEEPDAFEHWVLEVRKFQQHLAARFAVEITEARLAPGHPTDEPRARPAPPVGRPHDGGAAAPHRPAVARLQEHHLRHRGRPAAVRARARTYGRANGRCPTVTNHASRITHHPSPVRVLLTGVPLVHGAERVLELIEGCGAVVVCMENCTGLKPILEDVDLDNEPDPIRAIAKKYYHLPCSVMTPNPRRFETLRALAAKFRPQCVIELVWQACLTYDVESWQVRKLVEEELRLPYLKITTDYSPSDSARITARVEALLEMVRAKGG